MGCGLYLARHSAYLDGELTEAERRAHEAHEAGCAACARYASVLRRGAGVLRELPQIAPAADFHQRLQHRIYHVQDESVLARAPRFRSGWLAAAAGLVLLAGGSYLIEARTHRTAGPPAEATISAALASARFAGSWTTPPVPTAILEAPILPAFAEYSPVVVRPPLYQPVSYELLAGE